MRRFFQMMFGLAVVTLLAAQAPDAGARTNLPLRGGPNGVATSEASCPAGEILVGFNGRTGDWLDAIRPFCGRPTADGGWDSGHTPTVFFGGSGGYEQTITCAQTEQMLGVEITLRRKHDFIWSINFQCVNQGGNVSDHQLRSVIQVGDDGNLADAAKQRCTGASIVGFGVRYANYVNAMGLICDQVAVAAPPAPPGPPPAPEKPIKRTGEQRTPIDHSLGAGAWQVTPSVGAPFKLVLREDADTATIIGELRFERPVNNGTLKGSRTGTMYRFTYDQPGVGIAGTGSMMTFNGVLAGEVKTAENPPRTIKWKGLPTAAEAAPAEAPAAAADAARPAPDAADPAAASAVTVKLAVDVYAAAGGAGQPIASIEPGTSGVSLVEPCQDNWCHVRWEGKDGWVYSGPDYNSLGR